MENMKYYWVSFIGLKVVVIDGVQRNAPAHGNICVQSKSPYFYADEVQHFISQEVGLASCTVLFWKEIDEAHYNAEFNRDAAKAMNK